MSKNVILIENEESLGERVFALSDAGQKELTKKDWQGIAAKDRLKAMDIYNALRANKGIIDLTEKKISRKKKVESAETISLEDLKANFDKLSREEQSSALESMDNLKATNQKATKEEGFKKLPEDIRATLGMSPENLKKLTKDQRTTLVKQFDDILIVEKEAKKKEILKEFVK